MHCQSTRSLTVTTHNLWGHGEPWRYMAERGIVRGAAPGSPAVTLQLPSGIWPRRARLVARALDAVRPDLVGLQEVCLDLAGEGVSHAEELARQLGLHWAFHPMTEVDYGGGLFASGLGVLSRHPIVRCADVPLPSAPDAEQYALHAVIEAPIGQVDLIVVHLTPRSEEAQLAAVERLLAYLEGLPSEATSIMVGDFNAVPESPPMQALAGTATSGHHLALRDAWSEAQATRTRGAPEPGPTMPSHAPTSRIDYILVGPGPSIVEAVRLGEQPDVEGFYASDHLGVAATLHFP
jgi:endonuclease/exonuclease/phosphatase family metal-dependent hydrolase